MQDKPLQWFERKAKLERQLREANERRRQAREPGIVSEHPAFFERVNRQAKDEAGPEE